MSLDTSRRGEIPSPPIRRPCRLRIPDDAGSGGIPAAPQEASNFEHAGVHRDGGRERPAVLVLAPHPDPDQVFPRHIPRELGTPTGRRALLAEGLDRLFGEE